MIKKTILVLGVLLIAYFFLSYTDKTENTIRIGYIGPLTGEVSSLGIPTFKAVQLAVNEANQNGGINGKKIELFGEDGGCNSRAATEAGNKLINVHHVTAIIGGFCSGETSAFGPMAMKNKVIVISPASSLSSLNNLGTYFFRVYPSDEYQGKFAAEYVFNTLGIKKAAVLYSNTDWGLGIKNTFVKNFESLGGVVVFNEGVTQDTRDFKTIIGKIKSSGAELLYSPQYTESSIVLLKELSNLHPNIKVFGADSWADSKFQKDAEAGALYAEVKTGSNENFISSFTKAYPEEKIGVGVAQGYDATKILLNSIKSVGTDDRYKLAEAIRSVNYDGVSNHIQFAKNGDMLKADYIVKELLGNGKVK